MRAWGYHSFSTPTPTLPHTDTPIHLLYHRSCIHASMPPCIPPLRLSPPLRHTTPGRHLSTILPFISLNLYLSKFHSILEMTYRARRLKRNGENHHRGRNLWSLSHRCGCPFCYRQYSYLSQALLFTWCLGITTRISKKYPTKIN